MKGQTFNVKLRQGWPVPLRMVFSLGVSALVTVCMISVAPASLHAAQAQASAQSLRIDANGSLDAGGVLLSDAANVLIDRHGLCRWVDNSTSTELFVPYRSAAEWQAFIDHAPSGVVRDGCCPARAFTLTASNGQTHTLTSMVGRDRAGHALAAQTLEHTFAITTGAGGVPARPEDCTTHFNGVTTCNAVSWAETVRLPLICQSGAWSAAEALISAAPPPNPPAFIGPRNCPPAHGHGTTWFETTGSGSRPATVAECPAGVGTRAWAFDTQTEKRCFDGAASPTGVVREVNGRWVGDCVSVPTTPQRGQLRWDENWTGNNFSCDEGYTLALRHVDRSGSNNANWYECVGTPPAHVIASGSIPVVGKLHWDGIWTGNNFWCDAGYALKFFHTDRSGSNNANWYECHGTVSSLSAPAPTGRLHWDENWTGNNFWCDAGYTLSFFHVDRSASNNANWYACQ